MEPAGAQEQNQLFLQPNLDSSSSNILCKADVKKSICVVFVHE